MTCRNHVDVEEGVRLCTRCRMPYCGDCLVTIHGAPYCAACKTEKLLDVQSGTDAAAVLPLANIGRRFAAVIIDRMLFGFAVFAAVLIVSLFVASSKSDPEAIGFTLLGIFGGLYLGMIVYEGLMLASRGQTLGKIAMKIKVVRPDGLSITTGQAWGRTLLRSIMVSLLFLLNYIPAFVTKEKTCLHDLVANTRVVTID
jgi:uncharacterized RDD family membrane protein YckC